MADFCRQCWGEPYTEDLSGITTEEAWQEGKAAIVLCEGCGIIQVDPQGNCISPDCFEKEKPGHQLNLEVPS